VAVLLPEPAGVDDQVAGDWAGGAADVGASGLVVRVGGWGGG